MPPPPRLRAPRANPPAPRFVLLLLVLLPVAAHASAVLLPLAAAPAAPPTLLRGTDAVAPPVLLRSIDDVAPPGLLRSVDDVAPAFANATESAITSAELILTRYASTLQLLSIPIGLAITFFGYFLLAPVLFLAAFLSGGGVCFVAVVALLGDDTPAAAWLAIAAMLLGGALLGFLALRALNFGMFAVGAALGVVLAAALKTSLIASAYPQDPEVAFYVAAAVAGLVFGVLAVCLKKQMLIFSTAYAGSCACMFGIGQLAGHFPTAKEIAEVEKGQLNAWVLFYILLTAALGTTGMFFQFWLGRDKPMPTHAPRDRRRRRRRARRDPDDWSEADDDWADESYVERIPLPPAKKDYVVRPDLQSDVSGEPHAYKADQMPMPRRSPYTHQSWNNVTSAPNAFDDDDSPFSSDPAYNRIGREHSEMPKDQGSPAVKPSLAEPEVDRDLVRNGMDELKQQPENNFTLDDTAEGLDLPKTDELAELGAGVYDGEGDNKLVSVSLESDIESPQRHDKH